MLVATLVGAVDVLAKGVVQITKISGSAAVAGVAGRRLKLKQHLGLVGSHIRM